MLVEVIAIYRRVVDFARGWPLVIALPFVCAFIQRASYDLGVVPMEQQRTVAIGFTVVNTTAMLIVTVFAFRWWRFAEDRGATTPLSWRAPVGAIVMLVVQLTDEFLITTLGNMVASLAGVRNALFRPGALLVWLFISIPLYPWYVGLIADDRAMTLRRAFAAIRPRWFSGFALVLGSLLPVMALGMALRYARFTVDGSSGWIIKLADLAIAPLLVATTASAYFAIYERAKCMVTARP